MIFCVLGAFATFWDYFGTFEIFGTRPFIFGYLALKNPLIRIIHSRASLMDEAFA